MLAIAFAVPGAFAQNAGLAGGSSEAVYKDIKVMQGTAADQLIPTMQFFEASLGVTCNHCHAADRVANTPMKETARQMISMVKAINKDNFKGAKTVTCNTCHRGVSRPMALEQLIQETAQTQGADSAARAYRALRERYYGRAAYDFGEPTLDIAAFRLARAGKFAEAFAILGLNETQFPASSNLATFRANISLMKGDTAAAIAAFREAVRRDSTNGEAQGRLRQLTRP